MAGHEKWGEGVSLCVRYETRLVRFCGGLRQVRRFRPVNRHTKYTQAVVAIVCGCDMASVGTGCDTVRKGEVGAQDAAKSNLVGTFIETEREYLIVGLIDHQQAVGVTRCGRNNGQVFDGGKRGD